MCGGKRYETEKQSFVFSTDDFSSTPTPSPATASVKPADKPKPKAVETAPAEKATPMPSSSATPVPTPMPTPEPMPVYTPDPTPVYTPEPIPVYTPDPTPVYTPMPTPTPRRGTLTIRYNANGGTGAPSSHNVTKDERGDAYVSMPYTIPTREGYYFVGWLLNNNSDNIICPPGYSFTYESGNNYDETLTFYAKWFANATPEPTPQPVTLTSIQVTPPDKTAYYINERFNSSGMKVTAVYSDNSTRNITSSCTVNGFDSSTAGKKAITVSYTEGGIKRSAQFYITVSKRPSIVQYNANGGSGAPPSQNVTKDERGVMVFYLSKTIPTRSGYTFLGWRLENSSAYGIDNPGDSIAFDTGDPDGITTLTYYAQWKKDGTLDKPKNFKIVKASSDTAKVSWDPVPGATSYEVEFWSRSWNEWRADYEYSSYLGTQTTSYITKGLSNHPYYEFRVRAKNSSGVSEWEYFTYYK